MSFTIALSALALSAPAAIAQPSRTMMQHATGTFEVKITPEDSTAAPPGGMATARMGIAKTFSGGLGGTAVGTMLSAGTPTPGNPAAYVAVDQFSGAVDGRKGGFLLLHRGTISKAGESALEVIVAPDSGTGELAGLTGKLEIEVKGGKHLYDFAYSLPAR